MNHNGSISTTRRKLQKARLFWFIFLNVVIYKMIKFFELYALRRVGEIEPMCRNMLFSTMSSKLLYSSTSMNGCPVMKQAIPCCDNRTVFGNRNIDYPTKSPVIRTWFTTSGFWTLDDYTAFLLIVVFRLFLVSFKVRQVMGALIMTSIEYWEKNSWLSQESNWALSD